MKNLKMLLWMMLLTGVLYPLLMTGIAELTMSNRTRGEFVKVDGRVVGAALIAQKFENPRYFWGRPSAVDYNPLPSGGSNLGPTSAALKKAVEARRAVLMKAHAIGDPREIPSELLFASGSGLDPHISPATAQFQVKRIIHARGWGASWAEEALSTLIHQLTEGGRLQVIGVPCLNVLRLNVALDRLEETEKKK